MGSRYQFMKLDLSCWLPGQWVHVVGAISLNRVSAKRVFIQFTWGLAGVGHRV